MTNTRAGILKSGDVSGPSIPVTATGVNLVAAPESGLGVAAYGNSNADNNFRYGASLVGYIINLITTGLVSGVYVFNFTAGDDPDPPIRSSFSFDEGSMSNERTLRDRPFFRQRKEFTPGLASMEVGDR
jgi:hypothetical protein